jgi:hypothetical protein
MAQIHRNFLSQEVGQVVLARARALEVKLALDACHGKGVTPERAAGFSDAINWLESLAQVSVSPAAHGELRASSAAEDDAPALEPAYTH